MTKLASMAKLKCGRLIREVADSCLQYWGGMGYTWENPLSRAMRDGRLVSIGGGADEVMLGIICKLEGTLPREQRRSEPHGLMRGSPCICKLEAALPREKQWNYPVTQQIRARCSSNEKAAC